MSGTWVFSYGSNSSIQLRARVHNPNLVCLPASVDDYTRIFCLASRNWSTNSTPSGAASLAQHHGASTFGCAALMTDEELERLDIFEGYVAAAPELGVYRRAPMTIRVWPCVGANTEDCRLEQGIAYIANDSMWQHPPSEQYLTAIHLMLREQWCHPEHPIDINVRGILDDDISPGVAPVPKELYIWQHPGEHSLSLPALCVEVNVLRDEPWVMPRTIKEIVAKLSSVGVLSSAHLAVWLGTPELRDQLNDNLVNAGHSRFHDNTLLLFKRVIGV
mmetsp:Transcript_25748/g.43379  ORF Transcript_25748/g.43379 Transcript_25748/m.43379 type:complete len:275 (+) Transcript_25748:39-863(+)